MQKFENFPLSKISWMKVGGNAKLLFVVENVAELQQICTENKGQKIITLGALSNTIVRDGGFDGVVLRLDRDFKKLSVEKNVIHSGCGVGSKDVAKFAAENGLSGLEFLYTIPGTVGGNVKMNAGCYSSEVKDVIAELTYFDLNTMQICTKNASDLHFEYRKLLGFENCIFLFASFRCQADDKEKIKSRMEEMNQKRLQTQPQGVKTCGSTFKNTTNAKAWELVDQNGFRGFAVGGAKMSEKHCNFMLNFNNATASDMENLGNLIIQKVAEKTGIKLEWEIDIIGEKSK
ncbi:MAG: UDP-N-acetylenolpyruvoylglucosamine reductase [Pseudomonadota bacterium]|jgi:UDP-N-acetylmuramate dehydrogenase